MHLFSTPVQCTNCGTTVDDPTVDKCPECGELLRERRTPGRLAGVEQRYGQVRFLMGFLRFLAVITLLVGVLFFLFSDETVSWEIRLPMLLATVVVAVGLWVIAALFLIIVDMEENTRASFRVQQMVLDAMEKRPAPPRPAASLPAGDLAVRPEAPDGPDRE